MSEVKHMREGTTLFSMIYPAQNENLVKKLQKKNTTCFAMARASVASCRIRMSVSLTLVSC